MDVVRRRRGVGVAISVLFAVVLTVAVAGRGCDREDSEPVTAVHAFYAALRAEDHVAVMSMLGPATQKRLRDKADQLGDVAGGQRRYEAIDMLSIDSGAITEPPQLSLESRHDDSAQVRVEVGGTQRLIQLVRVDGVWRLEI